MRRNGLTKYDAPLRIQFQWGYEAFKKHTRKKRGKRSVHHIMDSGLDYDTMQHREWQRGWNTAYFESQEKLNEPRTRG